MLSRPASTTPAMPHMRPEMVYTMVNTFRGADAGHARRLRVAADAVDLPAQRRAAQEHVEDGVHDHDQDRKLTGKPKLKSVCRPIHRTESMPLLVKPIVLRMGDQKRGAPEHVLHAQRGHEGVRQVQPGQEHVPLTKARQRRDAHGSRRVIRMNGFGHAEVLHQDADQAGGQDRVVADGEVDAGGDQRQQHARADQAVDRGLLEDVHQVVETLRNLSGSAIENTMNRMVRTISGPSLIRMSPRPVFFLVIVPVALVIRLLLPTRRA